ncbi:MAG: zinc-dependent alcohol dehydrogenase [Anaerolineae bacterium]
MTQTRAVVIPQPGQVLLQEVTLRDLKADEVVIETAYTSISAGTERMLLAGQMPHPMLQLPVVPGYETVGHVVALGTDVSEDWLGKAVYIGGAHCYKGVNSAWGGQSARLIAPVNRVIPLESVDARQGVLLALTATALHGVDVLNPAEGERVLVIGQGPVGQLAARILSAQGNHVIVTDINPERLKRSHADQIINVQTDDLKSVLSAPVNAIIEASGSMMALNQALPHLANGGTILLLGYYQTLELPYMPLFLKEAQLRTAKEWSAGDLVRSRDMIADGTLEVASLLTHDMPIESVTAGYDVAMNDPTCLKLVLNWSN